MKKRLLSIIIFSSLLLAAPTLAAESVSVTLPTFPVTFNGQAFDNTTAQYPLIVYQDITYIPMTWNLTQFLGLKTYFDQRGYGQNPSPDAFIFYVGNQKTRSDTLEPDTAAAPNTQTRYTATLPVYQIYVNDTRGQARINNQQEKYPILNFRGITYLPLTYRFAHDSFGWDYAFDTENGLVIDTRNAFRPEWDYMKLWNTLPSPWGLYYAVTDDSYVGFHPSTFSGQYSLIWGRRGMAEKEFSLEEDYREVFQDDIYFDDLYNDQGGRGAAYLPQIDGNIFTIFVTSNKQNYVLKVDLEAEKILSATVIPPVPYEDMRTLHPPTEWKNLLPDFPM